MYTSKITYPVYQLNSTLFIEELRNVLQTEFVQQITEHGKTFLPSTVASDNYLINPINSYTDLNPAFVAVTRLKSDSESAFTQQNNLDNTFVIQIVAVGLDELRQIADAIFIILNDMDVKHYFNHLVNDDGDKVIFDSGIYKVDSIVTNIQPERLQNNKDVITGYLQLVASIQESVKFNDTEQINSIVTTNKIGNNEIEITQTNTY